MGSPYSVKYTDTGTNPEEGCQVRDERLHDKDIWLWDPYAKRSGMGHSTEETVGQQILHAVQD